MATENILLAGFGGQGVLFAGKVIASAGLIEGRELSWLPSYGPEMRGGTANCSVVLSDDPIGSPLVTTPDALIAMNQPSFDKFCDKVTDGQAEARLLAAGFRLTNNDSIPGEKDWVYAVKYRGNSLEIGAKVPMGAILTLVIGNGEEAPADSLQVDSLDVPQVQGEVLEEEDWF